MEITVKINSDKIFELLKGVQNKAVRKATAKALNDTGKTLAAQSNRQIRAQITMKAADVRESLYRKGKASASMQLNQMAVVVGAKGGDIPLIKYSARQTKRGVSAKVLKKGKRSTIKGAFIATMGNGKRGVFMRKSQADALGWKTPANRKRAPRSGQMPVPDGQKFIWRELPIMQLFSKRVSSAMRDEFSTLQLFAQETFDKRFSYWFAQEMRKLQ
jgi:hypothetical protein